MWKLADLSETWTGAKRGWLYPNCFEETTHKGYRMKVLSFLGLRKSSELAVVSWRYWWYSCMFLPTTAEETSVFWYNWNTNLYPQTETLKQIEDSGESKIGSDQWAQHKKDPFFDVIRIRVGELHTFSSGSKISSSPLIFDFLKVLVPNFIINYILGSRFLRFRT